MWHQAGVQPSSWGRATSSSPPCAHEGLPLLPSRALAAGLRSPLWCLSGRKSWRRLPHFPIRTPKPRLREPHCSASVLGESPHAQASELEEESHRNAADQTLKLGGGISGTLGCERREVANNQRRTHRWGCPSRGNERRFQAPWEGGGQLALSPRSLLCFVNCPTFHCPALGGGLPALVLLFLLLGFTASPKFHHHGNWLSPGSRAWEKFCLRCYVFSTWSPMPANQGERS